MIQIIPAILATNEQDYQDKLKEIESVKSLKGGWVQIDLMDNKFVHNKSINPDVIRKYPTNLKIEAQLMVVYPENWIDQLIKASVQRIVFPVEDLAGIDDKIKHIKNHGLEVGLSVNPQTTIDSLTPFLDKLDLVLIMSVEPGFGGQQFLTSSLQKVKQAFKIRQDLGLSYKIEVDGGINEGVISELAEAGVDGLVIGSHLLQGDIEENVEKIWEVLPQN